jgi:hypothetical protein
LESQLLIVAGFLSAKLKKPFALQDFLVHLGKGGASMATATLSQVRFDRAESHRELDSPNCLHVSREDIVFANVTPECVRIAITVHNRTEFLAASTTALLMAAPLGAFVNWRPLTVQSVPEIEPGDSVVLTTDVLRTAVTPLGPPNRVRPRQVLTALGAEDDQPRGRTVRSLPADILELLGKRNVHWAGNLNVFIGTKPVERHRAQALRVYPDRLNMAMFVVGEGRDAYRFHLIGEGATWNSTLYDMTDGKSFALDSRRCPPVTEDEWIEAPTMRMMMLALAPPRECQAGSVAVHVTQRSSGRTAVVEFSLDPNAAGPGCYVV